MRLDANSEIRSDHMTNVTEAPLLFENYPKLKGRIPWIPLGNFPTPVQKLDNLGREIGAGSFYVKRDDLSSNIYGGNKIRKLEFLLAEARQRGANTLITGGGVGSNFSLATTIHGQRLGMRTILLLMDQPTAEYAKRNMLLDYYHQAKMLKTSSRLRRFMIGYQFLINIKPLKGKLPYVIVIGGSSELGSLGFINAAFELKKQVETGILPEPDYLFVAASSLGTFCGLWLGCQLANLKTKVVGVKVSSGNTIGAANKINNICQYLRKTDPGFPHLKVSSSEVTILEDFRGERYAQFTKEGMKAILLMHSLEKIKLEGTYTGKTLAGTLDYIKKNHLEDRVLLFWNTYNSIDLSHLIKDIDYHKLPRPFHKYFELPNQEFEAPL